MKPSFAFLLVMLGRLKKKRTQFSSEDAARWKSHGWWLFPGLIFPPVSSPGAVMNGQLVYENGGY